MSFGTLHLGRAVADFMERYPDFQIQLILSDQLIDPVQEGFDVTLRIADLAPSSMIARKIAPARRVICAAASYPGFELGIELAGLLPAQHVERFDELADTVNLGAEQAKLDDLFIAKVLGEIAIHLVLVDGVLALFEQIRIMQRCLLTRTEARAATVIE
jgi:hypothetical protein